MTSPRVYEDPIGTQEVQEQRGTEPDDVREGLHDVDGGTGDERGADAGADDAGDAGEDVADPGGDSDPNPAG